VCARASRPDRLAGLLDPAPRFVWGALVLLLFLPQRSLVPKLAEVLLYGALGVMAGKRISWPYFVFLTFSIAAFNLLSPWGRVVLTLGPLRITEGALIAGLSKGVTVTGLVLISLFSVSRDLRLPGRFGAFLSRSLFYFERLSSQRRKIRPGHVWQDIDAVLEDAFPGGGGEPALAPLPDPLTARRVSWRTAPAGAALAAATLALAAAALILARGPLL
jgi:hypothetical protein